MAIEFACRCGAEIGALDGQAGRRLTCPSCRGELVVPRRSAPPRPEPVPDLGIDLADPARPAARPRRPASRAGRLALAILAASVRPAALLLLVALGLVAARTWRTAHRPADPATDRVREQLDRMRESREDRERAAAEEAAAEAEAAGRARDEADREASEAAELEAKEARLRAATRAVLAYPRPPASNGLEILRSEELPGGRFAVLAKQRPFTRREDGEEVSYPGNVEAYLVEAGAAFEVSEERLEWETLAPEDLACAWAGRHHGGEGGPYRARVLSRADFPAAALEAVVTDATTGFRERLSFAGFAPSGRPEFTLTPIDR